MITESGGSLAFECDTGVCVYFSRNDQSGLWRVDLTDGTTEQIHSEPAAYDWALWELVGDQVYYVDRTRPANTLKRFHPGTGKVTVVSILPERPHGRNTPISVSSALGKVAYTRIVDSRHDIMYGQLFR